MAFRLAALVLACLALGLSLGAPGRSAAMVAATLAGDPVSEICSTTKGGHPAPAHHGDQGCAVCIAASVTGASLAAAAPPALYIPVETARVEHLRPAVFNPRGPPARPAQARAPPLTA